MNPQVLPVIHYLDRITTIEQARIAKRAGSSGIFLISHKGDDSVLLPLAEVLKQMYPDWTVGVNMLTYTSGDAFAHLAGQVDAIWVDNCGITSAGFSPDGYALEQMFNWHQEKMWKGQAEPVNLFASVAFKYQKVDPNPALAAYTAKRCGYIPTTSGPGTGSPPELEKIQKMYEAAEGCLAIASGMTPENIGMFAPFLSHVLVSTGISSDGYHFDEKKLDSFIDIVKNC